jgi:hypothetical protein
MEALSRIFCSQCGAALNANDKFCPKCGTAVTPADDQSAAGSDTTDTRPASGENTPAVSKRSFTDPKFGDGPAYQSPQVTKNRNAPVFLTLSIIAFVLFLGTPRFLLFFPLMATLGFAVVSLFRKEKGRIGTVIILVLTGVVFVLSQVGNGTFDFSSHSVTYRVDGTAKFASVVYENEQGGTEQETVRVPWQKDLTIPGGQFVYISAQNNLSEGGVTVSIVADGKEFKRSESYGGYKIATASGSCC